MVKNKVKISALGTANHIPFIFNIFGSINKPIVINPNVRRKDNIAETLPFDNAVNIDEVKILYPQKIKLKENI
ncbi:hypothetical protein BN175_2300005 [Clostridioides difficile T23]|nr:hypothetical protein BN173_3080013 [Clostridioides difficile T11]CCL31618.1 hypothetical protein BN174_2770013 [Clostridioides difficile E15]CCL35656.1 hypothetical protein BN175_2300005 [Clostridioides difficile T23]CCL39512.1 hypothetical protein BN176_2870015 [Clostridioides difficile E19]